MTAADAGAHVAVVDAGYAASHGLRIGSHLTIGLTTWPDLSIKGIRFTVIGIVRQAAGSNPPSVYIR